MVTYSAQAIPENYDPPTQRRIEVQRQKQIRALLEVRRTLIDPTDREKQVLARAESNGE